MLATYSDPNFTTSEAVLRAFGLLRIEQLLVGVAAHFRHLPCSQAETRQQAARGVGAVDARRKPRQTAIIGSALK